MLYILDENYSHRIAEGLNTLESGNKKSPIPVTVEHIIKLAGKTGAPDEEVIRITGSNDGTLFTKDKDFRTIKSLYPLFEKHAVGIVFFKQHKKGVTYWENIKTLVMRWEELKEKIYAKTPPFAFEIDSLGIKPCSF